MLCCKLGFIGLLIKPVIANQCAHWCGNPLTFPGYFRYISVLTRGFPEGALPRRGKRGHPGVRQFENWLGMTDIYYACA